MKQAVVGLGRFGTFWAGVLSGAGTVYGWNRSPRPPVPGIEPLGLEGLADCDTVWLCTAISSMEEITTTIAPHLSPGTLVVDTCSVKVWPVQVMERNLPAHVDLMASHPMFGPDSARNGLANLALVLSPVRMAPERYQAWAAYFQGLGLRVIPLSPEEHDRQAARTQGVTHFVGRYLSELGLSDSPIATLGFQKIKDVMEQTCNDPWQLFLDLQRYNPYGAATRVELRDAWQRLWDRMGPLDPPPAGPPVG